MKLAPQPFEMIKTGKKTIELQLWNEKRRKIHVGDVIEFVNNQDSTAVLNATVLDLLVFDSFETMYKNLPLLQCGYTEENVATASPNDMNIYYSTEQQSVHGVVGIKIALKQI